MRNVGHLEFDQVACAQLRVDRGVEQSKVACPVTQLQPDPDRPDVTQLQRGFLAGSVSV